MSGYGAREGLSTGVHDPLRAAALVLSDDALTVGLVSVDLLNVSRRFVERVRATLARSGTEVDEVVIAATHTHAGPYVKAPALAMEPLLRAGSEHAALVEEVETELVDGVGTALRRADERCEPADVRFGRTTLDGVQHNRRASGGVGGNVRMPTGAVDSDLTVLHVETESGLETVVYGFACHPVCTTPEETRLSADWPGCARRRVRETRPEADVLFLNGAAGDINPCGSSERRTGEGVYDYMEAVGREVGDAVVEAVVDAASAPSRSHPPLVVDARTPSLPLKRVPFPDRLDARVEELERRVDACVAAGDDIGSDATRRNLQYVRTLRGISEWGARRLTAHLPYVEIGGVGLLGMPGEAFAAHGCRFKNAANADALMPVGYANGYVGYLPTLDDLENVGYEVRTAKVSPEGILAFERAALDLVAGGGGRRDEGARGGGAGEELS